MKKLLLILAILTLFAGPVAAQQYVTTTTLSSAVTATQTQITVASATNVQAGGAFYIDQEFIPILSVSGTTATVSRTNRPAAHASGQQVFVATATLKPLIMLTHSAAFRVGVCSTSTSSVRSTALAGIVALPIIDIDQATVYDCRRNGTNGAWVWNALLLYQLNAAAATTWAQ